MRHIILTCLALAFILAAFRPLQEFTVKGIITDDQNGSPVSGATVRVKGTQSGSNSGPEGRFSITVSGPSATLVFTAIGYDSKEVKVKNDGRELKVKLNLAKKSLDEVVVVGYGVQKDMKEFEYNPSAPAPTGFRGMQQQSLMGRA